MAKQAEQQASQEMRDLLKSMESHSEKTADALASLGTLAQASARSVTDAVAELNAINQNLTAQSIANQGIRQSLQQTARPMTAIAPTFGHKTRPTKSSPGPDPITAFSPKKQKR